MEVDARMLVSLVLGVSSVLVIAAADRPPTRAVGGVVHEAGGEPAGAAQVVLTCMRPRYPSIDFPGPRELSTVTDEAGRFWFEPVACNDHTIVAVGADGSRAATLGMGFEQDLELRLKRTTPAHGVVVDPAGNPVGDAAVTATWSMRGVVVEERSAVSADDGTFALESLTSGVWQVVAQTRERPRVTAALAVPETGEPSPIQLQLPPAGAITGWVAGLSAVDTEKVELLVDGAPAGVELGPDARFRIGGVPLGTHTIAAARRSSGDISAPARVVLDRDGQVVDVELHFERLVTLAGVVRCGAIGAPGLTVEVGGDGGHATATDAKGAWKVDDLGPGYYSIDILDPAKHPIVRQEIDATDDASLVTELAARELGGRVRTPGGVPLPGVTVWVGPAGSAERLTRAETREDGRFRFQQLPPGRYVLQATVGGRESDERVVELADAMRDADLELDIGDGLDLLVREPSGEPASRVTVRPVIRRRALAPLTADCTADGLCHVDHLDYGEYDVLVEGWRGAAALRVFVPSDVVRVQLVPEGTLEIRLDESAEDRAWAVRVLNEDGRVMPPSTFLGGSPWQPLMGLVTADLPEGRYLVDARRIDGRTQLVRVELPAYQRIGVIVGARGGGEDSPTDRPAMPLPTPSS